MKIAVIIRGTNSLVMESPVFLGRFFWVLPSAVQLNDPFPAIGRFTPGFSLTIPLMARDWERVRGLT